MSKQQFYRILVISGFLIWFIDTAVFGWRLEPESGVDNMFSALGMILAGWGILGDLSCNLTFMKTTNVKTKTVNLEIGKSEDEGIRQCE